jgi:hypothetical protein
VEEAAAVAVEAAAVEAAVSHRRAHHPVHRRPRLRVKAAVEEAAVVVAADPAPGATNHAYESADHGSGRPTGLGRDCR